MPEFRTPAARDRFTASLRHGFLVRGDTSDEAGHPAFSSIEFLGTVRGLSGVTAFEGDLSVLGDEDEQAHFAEIERLLKRAKLRLTAYGIEMGERSGAFNNGSFTSHDPEVRAFALQTAMRAMDRGSALGAKLFVIDTSPDGVVNASVDDVVVLEKRLRLALNFLAKYNLDRGYGLRLVLDGAHSPRAVVGQLANARVFHASLKHPDQFALAAWVRAGDDLAPIQTASEAGVLAQVDVARLHEVDPMHAFGIVRALDQKSFAGDRHLSTSARVIQRGDAAGVAAGIQSRMNDYLRLRERIKAWESDAEIKRLRRQIERHSPDLERLCASFSKAKAETLLGMSLDEDELGTHAVPYEALRHRTLQIIYGDA